MQPFTSHGQRTHVDKCRGYEDTGAKVLASEKGPRRDLHPLDLLGHDRESSAQARESHHQDCGELLEYGGG